MDDRSVTYSLRTYICFCLPYLYIINLQWRECSASRETYKTRRGECRAQGDDCAHFWPEKGVFLTFFSFFAKKITEKLAGLKIMRTFALPIQTGVSKEANNRENNKFIEKTDYCTRSKYRENTIYREALISLEIMKCQRQAQKFIRYYTMKSLILAQDERQRQA